MNYQQALKKSRLKRIIGFVIFLIGIVSSIISILKMLYFNFDDGTIIGGALSKIFKNLISLIYQNTQFLNIFWQNCPSPNLNQLNTQDNIYFLLLYGLIFIGLALYSSGKKLAIRLNDINIIIENQLIKESIMNNQAVKRRDEIQNEISIKDSSIFSQLNQLYLAPLITSIVGGILLKLLGF